MTRMDVPPSLPPPTAAHESAAPPLHGSDAPAVIQHTTLALSIATAALGAMLVVASYLLRRRDRGEVARQVRFLGAGSLLAGGIGALLALTPSQGSPRPAGAHVVKLRIGERTAWYSSEAQWQLNGQVLHVLADEPTVLEIELYPEDARCRLTIADLGIDALVKTGDSIWFKSNGATPSELELGGEGCLKTTLGIVPLARMSYFQWASATARRQWDMSNKPTVEDDVELGRRLAEERCAICHSADGTEQSAPTFKGLCGSTVPIGGGRTRVADRTYLHAKIEVGEALWRDPRWASQTSDIGVAWHTFQWWLDEREVSVIVNYLESLSDACSSYLPPRRELTLKDRNRIRWRHEVFHECRWCHIHDVPPGKAPLFDGMYGSRVELTDGTSRVVDDAFIRWVMFRGPDAPTDVRYPRVEKHDFRCKFSPTDLDLLVEGIREFDPKSWWPHNEAKDPTSPKH